MKYDKLLKSFRKKKGLTQEALAEMWDVPVKTIRHWEQGRNLREMSARFVKHMLKCHKE